MNIKEAYMDTTIKQNRIDHDKKEGKGKFATVLI